MAVDRTADWAEAVEAACQRAQLGEDDRRRVKASLMFKRTKSTVPFRQAADQVQASIAGLRAFIDENKREYVAAAGRFSSQQKDAIEAEVLQVVASCRARIEQLTNSIVAAQQQGAGGGGPRVNEQTVAHLHGSVLVLVELLHQASAAFDRCRSVRNAQQMVEDLRQRQRRAALDSALGRKGLRSGPPQGPSARGGGSGDGDGGGGGAQGQQQQQAFHDQETQQLLEGLMRSTNQVEQVERTVRDITAMQQMVSTAVMQQAEAIEQLYNVAVEATAHVRRGNEELRKTIAVNSSSTLYIVVMLLTASALLVLYDWLNS